MVAATNDGREAAAVRVVVRCRPFIRSEPKECKNVVEASHADCSIRVCDENRGCKLNDTSSWRKFDFDSVFSKKSKQEEVYDKAVQPMIARYLEGFNSTIFAYGQTSSGKTHTMMGRKDDYDESQLGVTPRAMKQIYEHITTTSAQDNTKFVVMVSFLEIYNEKVAGSRQYRWW
mmetsp:Transcript_19322/g.30690  ORF Transcript_19322/g.30690 Transcript_19322/m.30690 type:complete len:174 (-) Transcript_19322:62-583(-)